MALNVDDHNEGVEEFFHVMNPDVDQFKDVPFDLDIKDKDEAAMYGKPEKKSSYVLGKNRPD